MHSAQEGNRALSVPRLILIFLLFFVANLYSVFQRSALAVVSSDLIAEFSMTPSQLGTLTSCFLYAYAVMQILSGLLVTRVGVRSLIVGSILSAAVFSCFFINITTVGGLMLFRVLIGISCSFIYVPAINEMRKLAPPNWTTVLIGAFLSAGHVGSLLAASPLKALCDLFGWRSVFLWLTGIIPFFVGLLIWVLLPAAQKRSEADAKPVSAVLREMGRSFRYMIYPGVLTVILWSVLAGSPRHAFSSVWIAQFYENAAGYSLGAMSDVAFCLSIGCILGGPICGRISNRLGVMKTLIIATAVSGVIWFLVVPVERAFASPAMQMALMLLLGIAGTGGFTCAFATVKYFDIPQAAGLFTAIVNSLNFLASAVISQVIGLVVERSTQVEPIVLYGRIFACFCVMSLAIGLVLGVVNRKHIR